MDCKKCETRWITLLFSAHLTEELDSNDPSYLEALQRKAMALEKRVTAYKSRIMIVTVFDIGT